MFNEEFARHYDSIHHRGSYYYQNYAVDDDSDDDYIYDDVYSSGGNSFMYMSAQGISASSSRPVPFVDYDAFIIDEKPTFYQKMKSKISDAFENV